MASKPLTLKSLAAELAVVKADVERLKLAIQPVEPTKREVQVTAASSADSVQVSWSVTDAEHVTSFLVGRDGTDGSGSGPWGITRGPGDRSHMFLKLRPVEYTFDVAATYADGEVVKGSAKATPTGGAVRPDVVPGPTGERRVPLVSSRSGGSGLPFNRIVFQGGSPDLKAMAGFEQQVGGKVDGTLTFTARGSWGDFRSTFGDAKAILDAGGIVVVSMPHAPTSEGDAMNARGAEDAYRSQQRELGAWLAGQGFNLDRFVIRVDWEFNGDWYPWSAKHGGPEALKAAIRNYVTNLRAGGLTKARFDLCCNKGPSQAGAHFPQVFPGAEYIDVLGLDQYDQWAPAYSDTDWARELTKAPSVQTVVDLAKQWGVMWSWDEGGNTHPRDKDHGGDNPAYWRFRREFLAANADTCAWDNCYAHAGAPESLRHDFTSNPASLAAYRELYRA